MQKKKTRFAENFQQNSVALLGPFPPASGGIASNLQNLLASPLKEKYHFYCVPTTSRKCGSEQYQHETKYLKIQRIVVELFKYAIFLKKNNPDFVHINTSFGTGSFWRDSVYMAISRIWCKKVLFQIHGGNLNEFLQLYGKITNAVIKKIFKMPSIIGVLSLKQQQPFIEAGFSSKVIIFPNMLDVGLFVKNSNEARLKFKFPQDQKIIVFIAPHLFLKKGVYEFLKAASLVLEDRNDVCFVIAGTGGEEKKMKDYCEKNNIRPYIRFMGNLTHHDVILLLSAADIFTLPSYSEGLPMVILEALAAGLPVISTNVGAIPEVILDGENGFILEPKDYKSLTEKILFLLKNPGRRKAMGERNEIKVSRNYDLKVVAELFDSYYQKLL